MSDAIVIESNQMTAGIALRERGGYRFYASDGTFHAIDAQIFRRLSDIQAAVRRVLAEDGARRARVTPDAVGPEHQAPADVTDIASAADRVDVLFGDSG